jgi:hypothetical protein
MNNTNKELYQRNLINDEQFQLLEAIRTEKVVSLYYELRLMLYLGIMLFTGGVGYFAYQNIGYMGHLMAMTGIGVAIIVGFYFIRKFAKFYSNGEVTVTLVYFDYILILVSLLIIALFAYVQVYFDLVELLLNWTSFISAAIFLFMAYRYDNRALLAMAITAFTAAVGLSISPVNWAKGAWQLSSNLYTTSIVLGAALAIIGQVSQYKNVKKHFRFTYQNFGLLLYFIGCLSAMFKSDYELPYAFLTLVSAGILTWYTWMKKEFLFFIYANIAGYIAFTYLVFKAVDHMSGDYFVFVYYFPVTCITYLLLLFKKKSHFAHE